MNIFYSPPEQIYSGHLELTGQEARHASKVLRYREGDVITVVDGEGTRYSGTISRMLNDRVTVDIREREKETAPNPELILGMGIIKKKDRLEFAVEKAVELGVREIALFRSEHTVKEQVRTDRLQTIARSAMKQSLRAWLPQVTLFESLEKAVSTYPDTLKLMAHEKIKASDSKSPSYDKEEKIMLLIGPEGGFSGEEVEGIQAKGGKLVSLGSHRLRTETAAIVLISRLLLFSPR